MNPHGLTTVEWTQLAKDMAVSVLADDAIHKGIVKAPEARLEAEKQIALAADPVRQFEATVDARITLGLMAKALMAQARLGFEFSNWPTVQVETQKLYATGKDQALTEIVVTVIDRTGHTVGQTEVIRLEGILGSRDNRGSHKTLHKLGNPA